MTTTAVDKELYLSTFARVERELAGGGAAWTAPLRKEAIARFEALGFPTTRHESWRYTSVKPIARGSFTLPSGYEPDGLTAATIQKLTLASEGCSLLTFVNGQFAPELSRRGPLPEGIQALSLAEAMEKHRESVEPHLGRYASFEDQTFTALNTALMADGVFLSLPEGAVIHDPIHLLFVSAGSGEGPVMSHPRNLLVLGRGSQATVVESYVGLNGGASFTNAVTELLVGDHAVIDHYKVQREAESAFHVASTQVRLDRSAAYTSHSFSTGGALARNDLNVEMAEEGGNCTLNGLYVLSGRQHVDNHTVIDHAKPHCSSREVYKGVLDGTSRGVFDGKVIVREDAQKSDARQVNSNLLLSDSALVDTKPQLEINADDVKCAHAATIGQLDQDALFYLRARALGLEEARSLLIHGFVNEMLDRVRVDALRTDLQTLLYRRLDGAQRTENGS
jgi:Fe-S cluster assembly protein SufD